MATGHKRRRMKRTKAESWAASAVCTCAESPCQQKLEAAEIWTSDTPACGPDVFPHVTFSKPIRGPDVVWDRSLGDVSRVCLLINTHTHTHVRRVWYVAVVCVNSLRIHQSSQSDGALSSSGGQPGMSHRCNCWDGELRLPGRFQP